MSRAKPSDLEMQVLSLLWRLGPLSVAEVRQSLPDGKSRAYTTILSVLQVMEKKGLVDHTSKGAAHVYRPLVTQDDVMRPFMRDMLRNVFGGSPAKAVQTLLDSSQVDAEELSQIRQLIQEAERKQRD